MSNDLISRSDVLMFIENIKLDSSIPKNYGTLLDIMRGIRKLPTAYDVDKVVEQLNETREIFESKNIVPCINMDKAIEIVKAGGVNE